MKALALPLRRPIATACVYVAVLVLGLASLPGLPLGLAPDLELPWLTVSLRWGNASPEVMESLVTSSIESEVVRLPGAKEVTSVSGAGWGRVDVTFERESLPEVAELALRERLAVLRETLPRDLDPPLIERSVPAEMDPGAFFVMQMAGDLAPEALREILEDRILPRMAGVPGVSGTAAYGGSRPELRIDLDREVVERGVVRSRDVTAVLLSVGQARSLGSRVSAGRRLPVALDRRDARAASLRDAWIAGARGPMRLSDVATVSDGWAEPRRLSRLDGRASVQGVLEREAGSNVLQVADGVRRRLAEIEPDLPEGVALEILHDESETIRDEIDLLARRAGLSLILIFALLALSRRSVRAPVVVLASVLFSAVATFVLFRFTGLGINLVTLTGLALAFGMAVDNSIVLLENVDLRTKGRASRLKTLAATREVLFPLLAATATTAVVMTPFLYLTGDLRDYYLPFVLAVGLSLVASLVVALTLTPVLSRWCLEHPTQARAGSGLAWGRWFEAVLERLLRRPWVPSLVSVLILGASIWVFEEKVARGSIFQPEPDTTLRVGLALPPGASIGRTDGLIRSFEDIVLGHEFRREGFVEQVETFVAENRASLSVRFHPAVAASGIAQALKDELTMRAATVSGADVSVTGQGPGFSRSSAKISPAYQLRLRGPDWERLGELTASLGRLLDRTPRIHEIDTNATGFFVEDARELVLYPDRERLAEVGMTTRSLVEAIEPAIATELASQRFPRADGEVVGRVRYDAEPIEAARLLGMFVRTDDGVAVPVSEVVRLTERSLPGEIRRRDQRYERAVSFEYRGPRRVGDRFVRSLVENTELPPGYTLEDALGSFLTQSEEKEIWTALGMALLLVTMVSAALFESFLLPFVALLSIPLSFVAIPFTFWATGESFDRTAYVGLILLAGIAINNALLLVHRAGRILSRVHDPVVAARRAACERARPIVLTTATSVVGLLPLLWQGDAAASGTWRSLALSATAGLCASALFTLFVVPCLFAILARLPRSARARSVSPSLILKGELSR